MRAIRNSTNIGNLILDMFMGLGSTLIAAHRMGRICFGIEKEPRYCDLIVRRYLACVKDKDIPTDIFERYTKKENLLWLLQQNPKMKLAAWHYCSRSGMEIYSQNHWLHRSEDFLYRGYRSFQSEKQNEPIDPERCIFKKENFHFWDEEFADVQHLLEATKGHRLIYAACDPSLGRSKKHD